MSHFPTPIFAWMQEASAAPVGQATQTSQGTAPSGGATPPPSPFSLTSMLPIIGIMLFFMWFSSRSESKRRDEREKLLKQLERGAKVRTTFGVLGEVVSVGERDVVLAIADKVRINVLKANIEGPEKEPEAPKSLKSDAPKAEAKSEAKAS